MTRPVDESRDMASGTPLCKAIPERFRLQGIGIDQQNCQFSCLIILPLLSHSTTSFPFFQRLLLVLSSFTLAFFGLVTIKRGILVSSKGGPSHGTMNLDPNSSFNEFLRARVFALKIGINKLSRFLPNQYQGVLCSKLLTFH